MKAFFRFTKQRSGVKEVEFTFHELVVRMDAIATAISRSVLGRLPAADTYNRFVLSLGLLQTGDC